ncbi:MAG: signal peptidase I [Leptospiraceae bacterium]|nr:signal peptidase I [Leptospiraceae bacterium]MDW8305999.1 signal peptidase I [Leptospiraceae bacterium]
MAQRRSSVEKRRTLFWAIFSLLSASFLFQLFLRHFYLRPLRFDSASLEKTITKGSLVFLEEKSYDEVQKGEIVRVFHPEGGEIFCRVVATEGSKVSIVNGIFYLDGKAATPQTSSETIFPKEMSNRDHYPLTEIRPGYFFCLHDNWEHTYDSRLWGPFAISSVTGKVKYQGILFRRLDARS